MAEPSSSSSCHLDTLAPEMLYNILSYLPIASLLAFGATCRTNHAFHYQSLSTLHLAVFPRHLQALIAFLHSSCENPNPAYQVPVILPKRKDSNKQRGGGGSRDGGSSSSNNSSSSTQETPRHYRLRVIEDQNRILADIVRRYGAALQDLEFFAWELTEPAAKVLAQSCRSLRRLALCFDHPHARDSCIPSFFFDRPGPGSTMWNALAGIGAESEKALTMRGLESLTLERAGITQWQLRRLVEANPRLKELRLRKCAGVDYQFVRWLAGSSSAGNKLEIFWVEACEDLWAETTENLAWVSELTQLKSLSFRDCPHVAQDVVHEMNDDIWHVPELIGRPPASPASSIILEVDPACK